MLTELVAALESDVFRNTVVLSGVLVAIVSVATARSLTRKKQSADLLLASRNDTLLQDGHRCIRSFYVAPDKNIRTLADEAAFESEDGQAVRYLLNHFETVGMGIRCGIYDEAIIKRCWRGILLQTFDKAQPLIRAIRDQSSPLVFQELEWLATRWKNKPVSRKSSRT